MDKLDTYSDVVEYVSLIHKFTERTPSIEEQVADKYSRTCGNKESKPPDKLPAWCWYRNEEAFDKYCESKMDVLVTCEAIAFDIAEAIVKPAREVQEYDVEKQTEEDIKDTLMGLVRDFE